MEELLPLTQSFTSPDKVLLISPLTFARKESGSGVNHREGGDKRRESGDNHRESGDNHRERVQLVFMPISVCSEQYSLKELGSKQLLQSV